MYTLTVIGLCTSYNTVINTQDAIVVVQITRRLIYILNMRQCHKIDTGFYN